MLFGFIISNKHTVYYSDCHCTL